MPVMHTAIPYTGSTADQAVSTITVQLGAAKHLTRPLTHRTLAPFFAIDPDDNIFSHTLCLSNFNVLAISVIRCMLAEYHPASRVCYYNCSSHIILDNT